MHLSSGHDIRDAAPPAPAEPPVPASPVLLTSPARATLSIRKVPLVPEAPYAAMRIENGWVYGPAAALRGSDSDVHVLATMVPVPTDVTVLPCTTYASKLVGPVLDR